MSSLNPPLNKDDFLNSGWKAVRESSERKDCLTYRSAFWQKAREAKAAGNDREQAVFEMLGAVTSPAIKSESTDEFFAEIFQNLTAEQLDFLAAIAPKISDPWVEFAGIFENDLQFDEFVEAMAAHRRKLDAELAADEAASEESQSA